MKCLIFIISVIFISFQFTAQTNNKNQPDKNKSTKRIEASELKKKDSKLKQVTSKRKINTEKKSNKKLEPKVNSKNKTIRKPKK